MADAQASGACGRKIVWVQVPSPAFFFSFREIFLFTEDFPISIVLKWYNFVVTRGHFFVALILN